MENGTWELDLFMSQGHKLQMFFCNRRQARSSDLSHRFDYENLVSIDKQLFIAIYVDVLLIYGLDTARLEDVQRKLPDRFKLTNFRKIIGMT